MVRGKGLKEKGEGVKRGRWEDERKGGGKDRKN